MFDSQDELLDKIRLGEDTSMELKAVRINGDRVSEPKRDDLADDIAGIANTRDGVLVLGVDNKTRDIAGLEVDKLEILERFIFEICNQSINPPVLFQSFRMELPDNTGVLRAVLKVEIPKSLFVHKGPRGYFYRQGSSNREMPPEYLARLFQQRSQARLIRFEEQPVPGANFDDFKQTLFGRYLGPSGESPEAVLLKRNLLAKEERGAIRGSVAGVLFCCEHPERFLASAFIEAVRYRGIKLDSNYQLDAQKICGPLDSQISQAMAFLKRNQAVSAAKVPWRVDKPQFSERAVFEAIVNAVAHRDYSIAGSKIRFFMFDDRLEIYSPGALPNTVTVETMPFRQVTRNELITNLLAETPVKDIGGIVGRGYFMEKRGEGVPIILNEGEQLSGKKPIYRLIDDSELQLTMFAAGQENCDG